MTSPTCPTCQTEARKTDGAEVYPNRPDLHAKVIWMCDGCGAYCGCHPGTDTPLGTPAGPELRRARMKLHNEMIDPLWREADRCGLYRPEDDKARHKIRRKARSRVYAYLGEKLGIPKDEVHTGMFDIERCRAAWRILRSVSYLQIHEWDKARQTD